MYPELAAIRESVQEFPEANAMAGSVFDSVGYTQRTSILPPYGSSDRDKWLRWYYRHEYNGLVQGAFAGFVKKITSTPYEVKGPQTFKIYSFTLGDMDINLQEEDAVPYYQDVWQNAHFGDGWKGFLSRVLIDYLTQDFGAVIEIIGPGEPDKALSGAVTGLAHLDSARCIATGNPEYPIYYWSSQSGKIHKMHHTRVVRLVDMPDPDERFRGSGLCALSRAIAIVQREILMGRYVEQSLDDKPKPGIMLATGMSDKDRTRFVQSYRQEQGADEKPEWGKTIWFYSMGPDQPIKLEPINYSEPPDKFDFEKYVQLDVNALALALGVDKQEIWELGGGNIGSGAQSVILARKAEGKAYADVLTMLERCFNIGVLPDPLSFAFKYKDTIANEQQANIDQQYITIGQTMTGMKRADGITPMFSDLEVRRLLADRSETFQELLANEEGQVQASDDDQLQSMDDVTVGDDETNESTPEDSAEPVGLPVQQQPQKMQPAFQQALRAVTTMRSRIGQSQTAKQWKALIEADDLYDEDDNLIQRWQNPYDELRKQLRFNGHAQYEEPVAEKAYQATRDEFITNLSDLIMAGLTGDIERKRFGIILRAQLRRLGMAAYKDGMVTGGVNDDLSEDDLAIVQAWIVDQSTYVTDFANEVYRGKVAVSVVPQRAEMWANKSLQTIYDAGRMTSNKNAMYEWVRNPIKDSCGDCIRLNGQRHRLREYYTRNILPRAETLGCGGWLCGCSLVQSKERARGRF